jgi:leucyl-tRNA synthetase
VQVNGKVRAEIEVPKDTDKDEILRIAGSHERVQHFVNGQAIKKSIYVPGRLVNFVV